MALDMNMRMKQKQYEATIIDYVKVDNGHFISMSDDQSFMTLLRMTLIKELGLSQTDIFTPVLDPGQLLRVIKDVSSKHPAPILFMERAMGGRDLSFLVRQFKDAFPKLQIIVLTISAERERIMLLHEVGADNFIAKPLSTNTLIEKLAFTLKPQSKLGQLIDLAKSMLQQGQPEKALSLCEQILELKPNSAAGFLVKGDAMRQLKRPEEAKEAYQTASNQADLFLEPLRRLAELAGEMGDRTEQLKFLQQLDALSPLNVERKVDMGEIHLALGRPFEAEMLFDKAVEQITKEAMGSISTLTGRIAAFYTEKDPVTAEKFLRKSLEAKGRFLTREDINIFNQLGISLRHQGRWQDAIVEYTKALKIAPNDENLFYNLGMACAEGKDFREARRYMLKALEINPNLPQTGANIAFNLGVVFLQAGARERAGVCLAIALELNPNMTAAKQALARLEQGM
ncbi:MAG: tetratricopeptide repeat protein [Bilophila sp.]